MIFFIDPDRWEVQSSLGTLLERAVKEEKHRGESRGFCRSATSHRQLWPPFSLKALSLISFQAARPVVVK